MRRCSLQGPVTGRAGRSWATVARRALHGRRRPARLRARAGLAAAVDRRARTRAAAGDRGRQRIARRRRRARGRLGRGGDRAAGQSRLRRRQQRRRRAGAPRRHACSSTPTASWPATTLAAARRPRAGAARTRCTCRGCSTSTAASSVRRTRCPGRSARCSARRCARPLLPRTVRERLEPYQADARGPSAAATAPCCRGADGDAERLGPFRPRSMFREEDLDLCLRARAAGIQTVLHPSSGPATPRAPSRCERPDRRPARPDAARRPVRARWARTLALSSRRRPSA